jgi:DeoR/GlpR family transcriptional regulator of sugar metabolism
MLMHDCQSFSPKSLQSEQKRAIMKISKMRWLMPKKRKTGHTDSSPLYAASRQQEILKLLNQDTSVSVTDLAAHFAISRASIRRDLRVLQTMGMLQRTYGGAVKPVTSSREASFTDRQTSNYEEKLRIGEAAVGLIQPGMTVFIDGGTTTECMIPYFGDKALTVVTDGLNIITHLIGAEQVTIISIGGTVNHRAQTFGGVLALDNIQAYNMRFDMAFIACSAVSASGDVTNASFEDIPMKRRAIEAAQQTVLLADSSKIGCVAAGMVTPINKLHRLITGQSAPVDEVEKLRQLGLTVQLV